MLEKLAPTLPPDTLITDTGSTKEQFVERARMVFGAAAAERVLPGHPMAGKEHGGIENADPDLFRDAVWLITPINADQPYTARQQEYVDLLRVHRGACDRHDRSGMTGCAPGSATCRR